jgi:hypothetical protein
MKCKYCGEEFKFNLFKIKNNLCNNCTTFLLDNKAHNEKIAKQNFIELRKFFYDKIQGSNISTDKSIPSINEFKNTLNSLSSVIDTGNKYIKKEKSGIKIPDYMG